MNKTGITKETAYTPTSILFNSQMFVSIGVIVKDTGVTANAEGKKIIKAGTPIGGDINIYENRQAAAAVTNTAENGAKTQGVIMHDTDVTSGTANAAMLIWGFVNLDRITVVPAEEAKTALKNKVTFLKD